MADLRPLCSMDYSGVSAREFLWFLW